MTKWHENIPPHGKMCKKKNGDVRLITHVLNDVGYYNDKCNGMHIDDLTPLSPAELWQFMPWQPMQTAPKSGEKLLILCAGGFVDIGYWNLESDCFKSMTSLAKLFNAKKWLPLPKGDL